MFHSSGTIQSKTLVPLGISVLVIGISSLDQVEGGAHPVAREAAAEREHPPHQLVGIGPDIRLRRRSVEYRRHASTALRQKNASA